jgi:hypothetical protein
MAAPAAAPGQYEIFFPDIVGKGDIPVRYPRNNLLGDVLLDVLPRFAVFGNFAGQQLAQVSGSDVGHHAVIRDVLVVVDDLEGDAMLVSADTYI